MCLGSLDQRVGLQISVGKPVIGTPIPDPDVVVLVDVDRLEQRLITQPTVRIIGMGVDVTDMASRRNESSRFARASV